MVFILFLFAIGYSVGDTNGLKPVIFTPIDTKSMFCTIFVNGMSFVVPDDG